MKNQSLAWLGVALLLMVAGGGDCHRFAWRATQPPPPAVFSSQPTLGEVINVVNANRSRAVSLSTNQATLSGSGFPSMRTSLAIAPPRNLRLRASTGFTGSEVDLGSNDQVFWLWIKRNQPPAMLIGHHDQYLASAAGRAFPIRPEWLIEAIGLVYLDPNVQHIGPIFRPDGRLEVDTPVDTPGGRQTKVLVLDGRSGYVLEQHLLDERGQVIASALSSNHFRDPLTGLILPGTTNLIWPALGMNLRLEVSNMQVNPLDLSTDLWIKPQYSGYPEVDIANLSPPPGSAAAPMALPPGPAANAGPPLTRLQ